MTMRARAAGWFKERARKMSARTNTALPAGALLCLALVRSQFPGVSDWIQNRAFDGYQRLKPRVYQDAGVRIIDIDDETLAKIGQWPWPRTTVAGLTRRLREGGAAAIAFDAVFPEPDRTSPSHVSAALGPGADPALKAALARMPDHDRLFADEVRRGPVVLGFVAHGQGAAALEAKAGYAFLGPDPSGYLPDHRGVTRNLVLHDAAAKGLGAFSLEPESDAIVRRVPTFVKVRGNLLPSLSVEALRVAQGASTFKIKATETGLESVKVGAVEIPIEYDGRVRVHYTAAAPARTIPAWRLLAGKIPRAELEGRIFFVGTSAAGLKDLRPTPLNPAAPGVESHANALEMFLTGEFLSRPHWAEGAEFSYMLLLGLVLLTMLTRAGAAWSAPVALLGCAATLGASWHLYASRGWLLDPVFPTLGILLVYATWSAVSFVRTEAERRNVTEAFGKSLHPKLVAELAKHPERLALGGATREITVLFCDIRGFTSISELYDAQGLTRVINRFLTPMSRIIMGRFGYIDKYIGDCIMAFWNAPSDDAEHARNACRAALEMNARLKALNEEWRAEAEAAGRRHAPVKIGIGLNTGLCCVGYMGSDQKLNYTALGDDVNLASRLEGQSKPYGVNTVIGPRTRELASEFAALELDLIRVKGKTVPVRVFALVGDPGVAASGGFHRLAARHDELLADYRAMRWDKAEGGLAGCRALDEYGAMGGYYDALAARIAAFRAEAPPADWDGVFTAVSK
ncbi:MAG: adenylate/guanylate cyclase domain-containing protein [Elusimicrobiota bacterium]|nr:adenylate/guanylate cyclase domain-containing protein [Elusimicrobiota bacterium]